MTKPLPTGKIVKTALVGIEIELDPDSPEGFPLVRLGIDGTPRLTFLDIVVDTYGRHIPQRRTVGPDTSTEVTAIIQAYVYLSQEWQGKLDAEY